MAQANSVARVVLQLQKVTGTFSTVATDATAGVVMMEASIWGRMPEELMWEVLQFVPAAKLFQWQLVSRRWRHELTSAQFRRKRQLTAAVTEDERQQVIACVCPWVWPDSGANSNGSSSRSHVNKILEVDLASMVPRCFWDSLSWLSLYSVEAAAHGLVCISNRDCTELLRGQERRCVLNPITRTCVELPQLPFTVERWHLPTSAAGAVTILGWSGTAWVLATYHVAAAAGESRQSQWVDVPNWVPANKRRPPVYALLGDESYWYDRHTDRVHVQVLAPGQGGGHCQVEVSALTAPWPTHEYEPWLWREILVAHPVRGAVFFVSQLRRRFGASTACCVWRLVRQRMEWEMVALLDVAELERLTGASHTPDHGCMQLQDAYAVRNLVCCPVSSNIMDSAGSSVSRKWLPCLNLDTGKWELLLHNHQDLKQPAVMELRPDVFLSTSAGVVDDGLSQILTD